MKWETQIFVNGKEKQLEVTSGDILNLSEQYDFLVCSAFKGHYAPFSKTLIGDLYERLHISVETEAMHPEIDCREQNNYWVSKPINSTINRIGCIELLDTVDSNNTEAKTLCKSFSTLYDMLQQMNKLGMAPSKVILPILGSGNQKIELCYIIPPLITQCKKALQDIDGLQKITFCDCNEKKVKELITLINSIDNTQTPEDVFISYCSAQREYADCLRNHLTSKGIRCWMAPYSIPAGSSYQAEIPAALSKIPNVVLILSQEAESSRWVQKEVGCAIGSKHRLIPIRNSVYESSSQFSFLLDGEQIYDADEQLDMEENCINTTEYLLTLLKPETITKQRTSINKSVCADKKHKFTNLKDYLFIGIGISIVLELGIIIKKLR